MKHEENKKYKYNPAIIKAVNRFPFLYKKQAFEMLEMVRHDSVALTFDGVVCAAMLVLKQEFGFGKVRLKRFAEQLQRYIDGNCDLYDGTFVEGMIYQLKQHGIEYQGVSGERE